MLAGIYAEIKMTDRAMEYYRRVLAINPANPLARFQLGLLQLSTRQPQEALDTWGASLKDPDEFMAHFHSGMALIQLQRLEEARSFLEQTAQRMPKDHWLYSQLKHLLETI